VEDIYVVCARSEVKAAFAKVRAGGPGCLLGDEQVRERAIEL
jgi:hypothetical protein